MQEAPDVNLMVQEWLAGGDQLFKPVFEHYFPRLLRYAAGFTEDRAVSEELAMNVMLKVWQQKSRLTNINDFNSYFFTMMRHEVISMMRRKKPATTTLTDTSEITAALENITASISYRELLGRYRQCLEQLPPRRREAFILSREKGMSYAEIAAQLNVSIFTVQNHIASSIKFLRAQLHDYADFLSIIAIILPMLTVY
jgi:RNA polymerase sigma-70 factor (ECF subfamily)